MERNDERHIYTIFLKSSYFHILKISIFMKKTSDWAAWAPSPGFSGLPGSPQPCLDPFPGIFRSSGLPGFPWAFPGLAWAPPPGFSGLPGFPRAFPGPLPRDFPVFRSSGLSLGLPGACRGKRSENFEFGLISYMGVVLSNDLQGLLTLY